MENLDQFQLFYINLILVCFTSGLALYLPKKIRDAQAQKNKFHPEFVKFYKILNQSLKVNQPRLTYIVDRMPKNEFFNFYKGLKNIHGFKVELRFHRLENGSTTEYLVFDLDSYTGPREVELAMFEEPVKNFPPSPAAELYLKAGRFEKPNFKPQQNPLNNVIYLFDRKSEVETIGNSESKVVDLNSYRKNKVINYISDDNEGA